MRIKLLENVMIMDIYILPIFSVILLFIFILIFRKKRKIIRKSLRFQIILSFFILIIITLMHLFYENNGSFTISKILLGIVLVLNVIKIYRKLKTEDNVA